MPAHHDVAHRAGRPQDVAAQSRIHNRRPASAMPMPSASWFLAAVFSIWSPVTLTYVVLDANRDPEVVAPTSRYFVASQVPLCRWVVPTCEDRSE